MSSQKAAFGMGPPLRLDAVSTQASTGFARATSRWTGNASARIAKEKPIATEAHPHSRWKVNSRDVAAGTGEGGAFTRQF